MPDDKPRSSDGTFAGGAGWTSEQAREAARRSHLPGVRKSKDDIEDEVNALLQEAGVEPKDAPATLRVLAKNAIKGSSADMRLFLQQTGQLQGTNEKYDGKGPCPTCGQTPGEGLSIEGGQIVSVGKSLEELDRLISLSESLVAREHEIDANPIPYKAPE
jgi:hypothetical protein